MPSGVFVTWSAVVFLWPVATAIVGAWGGSGSGATQLVGALVGFAVGVITARLGAWICIAVARTLQNGRTHHGHSDFPWRGAPSG